MEPKKDNQLSMTSSEKPISFTKLVGEAEEERKDKEIFGEKLTEELPPSEVKPKEKQKEKPKASASSESVRLEKQRKRQARYIERKRQEAEKIPEPEIKPFELIDREVMKAFAGIVPFSILAIALKDDRYLCNDHEKDVLAAQWDKYIRIRIPDVFDKYGPEYALGLTISMFLIEKSGVFKPGTVKKEFDNKTETGFIKGYGT